MAEATFGERLMEARRIKGETIEEVSEQLRIRPSIILAMETSNFSHMPHKGYARNMVSSYARYLGLDSTRTTEQFLREFRRWESTGKRGSTTSTSRLNLASRRNVNPDEPLLPSEQKADGREMITAARRNKDRSSVWGKDNRRDTDRTFREQLRQVQEDQDTRQSVAVRRSPRKRASDDTEHPSASKQVTHTRQLRTNDYVGKPPKKSLVAGFSGAVFNRPVMLVIGVVVLFVVILILWAVLASTCSNNSTAQVPVTGIGTSDSGLDEDQASNNADDLEQQVADDSRYGPFELIVEVSEGASWIQIDIDGSTPFAEVFEAPRRETFTVTSSAKIEAGAPGYVKVYRNGTEVPIETVDGLGMLELAVEQRPIVQNAQDTDAQESQ